AGGNKGNADLVETGLDRNRRGATAIALLVADFRIPVVQIDAFAIDRHFQFFAPDVTEYGGEVAGHPLDGKDIFAVGRELVLDQHAAAGAERQAFDVAVL